MVQLGEWYYKEIELSDSDYEKLKKFLNSGKELKVGECFKDCHQSTSY